MEFISTEIKDLVIIKPKVFKDNRGYFFESYKKEAFEDAIRKTDWLQENESFSSRGVIRGLHYQLAPYAQSKLVRVITGSVLDVALDIRKGSPTFGKSVCVELNDVNKWQLYIPRGFAHGFIVLSENAIFSYKVDNKYAPEYERGIDLLDDSLNINWLIPKSEMLLSDKDKLNTSFSEADFFDFNIQLYV